MGLSEGHGGTIISTSPKVKKEIQIVKEAISISCRGLGESHHRQSKAYFGYPPASLEGGTCLATEQTKKHWDRLPNRHGLRGLGMSHHRQNI